MNRFQTILNWLRAGYPQGVPREDYVALLGVLHRSLTPVEVEQIALELGATQGVSEEQVREAIRRHTLEKASAEDIQRVLTRLDVGWPRRSPDDE